MTICLATDIYTPVVGGIPTFYNHLADHLITIGHRVFILTLNYSASNNGEDQYEICNEQLVIVRLQKNYRLYYEHYKPFFRPGGIDAPHWIALGFAMRQWLKENSRKYNIEIVEANDYGGPGFFLKGDDLPPVILSGNSTLHQIQQFNNLSDDSHVKVLKTLEKLSFRYADDIIAHSLLNKKSLEEWFNRQIEFAKAPFEVAGPIEKIQEKNAPLIIAGLQKIKGAITMANALLLLKDNRDYFSINWIGYDTWTAPGSTSMAGYLEKNYLAIWQKEFKWLGEMKHELALQEMKECSFVIIPSLWETFNYTVLEAACLGKAIIMTKTTGASYLFTHDHDALLIEPGNANELAMAIRTLSVNEEKRNSLGANARKTIEYYFGSRSSIDERIIIYNKAIKGRTLSGNIFDDRILFLKEYITPVRKRYYKIRALIKRIVKRSN